MQSPIGSPHRNQEAADNAMCVAMDEVVEPIGAVHVNAHETVRLREELRNVLVYQLMDPGNVNYYESPLSQPSP